MILARGKGQGARENGDRKTEIACPPAVALPDWRGK